MSRPINPWKDFASYKSSDARYFKGREESIAKFLRIVEADTMSVLYASSGIGKTSFLQAGVVPVMIERGYAPIHILFTDDDFAEGVDLSMILKSHVEDEIKKHNENEDKKRKEKSEKNEDYVTNKWEWNSFLDVRSEEIKQVIIDLDEKSLWWKFHTCEIRTESGLSLKPLLLLDQFEEVFVKAKAKNIQLQTFFDELEELASNNLPSEVETTLNQLANQGIFFDLDTHHHYKIIFSLRKEYLSDFDYWTNDRHSIAELQQNRMLLLPLSRNKAMKVIMEQPLNLDGSKCYTTLNNIAEEILNVIDDKKRNEIEPFILSVLCSRLYDRSVSLGKTELKPDDLNTYSANTIIREFYEQKMQSIVPKHSHITRIEEELIDEDGKRGRVKVKRLKDIEFEKRYKKDLEDAHLVRIDSYNGEDYIELVHDRVADAIMERRKESTKKNRLIVARIASFAFIIGLFFLTYYIQTFPTSNESALKFNPYLRFQDKSYGETEIDTTFYEATENIKIGAIRARDSVMLSNCPNLKSIHLYGDWVSVNVKGCQELKEISFGNECSNIKLSLADCGVIRPIRIPEKVYKIEFTCIPPNNLIFDTEESKYFLWKDNILWNLRDSTIVYARYDADTNILPPFNIKVDTLTYLAKHFIKADKEYVVLKYSKENGSFGKDTTIRVCKYDEELNLKDLPVCKYNFKDWDMSQFPNLRRVVLPKNWKSCGANFKGCTKLESVHLPDSLDYVGKSTFEGCSSLTDIVFPESVTQIGDRAFRGCSSLKEIILPDSVNLSYDAFDKCYNLEKVWLPRSLSITTWSASSFMFKECPNVRFSLKDSARWTKTDDNTFVYHIPNHANGNILPVLFINEVQYHTYQSDTFTIGNNHCRYFSKDGTLYIRINSSDVLLNDPIKNDAHEGCIVVKVSKVVDVPITGRNITLVGTLDSCREIHFPYPTYANRKDFLNDIPKEKKRNITLHVPYGSKPNFQKSDDFDADAWKALVEESQFSTGCGIFWYHLQTGKEVWQMWGIWSYVIVAVFLFAILMTYYNIRKNKVGISTKKNWMGPFGHFTLTIIVGVLTWYVVYWFLYLMLERAFSLESEFAQTTHHAVCVILSVCLAVMFIYIVLYSEGFNLKGFMKAVKRVMRALIGGVEDGYLFAKQLTWQTIQGKCRRLIQLTRKKNKGIAHIIAKKKRLIVYALMFFVVLMAGYNAMCYFNSKIEHRELIDYCQNIINKDTITYNQIDSLHKKLIDDMTNGIRTTYPESSEFIPLGDSIFIIKESDYSCHYVNFAKMEDGDIFFGGNLKAVDKDNFKLSDSGCFVSYFADDTLSIWAKDRLSQEPYRFKVTTNLFIWLDDDNYCIWQANDKFVVFNTKTGGVSQNHGLPNGSKILGCIAKKYLVCERENFLDLYRITDGSLKLIDQKTHGKDFSIRENASYCYANPYSIDSTFICSVIDDKLVFDTIPHDMKKQYNNNILYKENDSWFVYNVPARQTMNLGHAENYEMFESCVVLGDGDSVKVYGLRDGPKLLKSYRGSWSYHTTAVNNYIRLGYDGLFRITLDSLQLVVKDDFEFIRGGWFCEKNNKYFSLDNFDAGSYQFKNSILSPILRGGWCFIPYGKECMLENFKCIKLLITESNIVSEEQKMKLIQLIDKHEKGISYN